MKLLFDLRATQPNGGAIKHGGGKYAEIIFKRITERAIPFSCYYNSNLYISPELYSFVISHGIQLFDIKNDSIDNIVKLFKFDRIFSAIPNGLDSFDECPVYCTIHDLRPLELPCDLFYFKYKKKLTLSNVKEDLKFVIRKYFKKECEERIKAAYRDSYLNNDNFKIITVSEHSKYALLSYFPELKDKGIKVFYSPNTSFAPEREINVGCQKYFLSVSGGIWLKNVLRSVIAFDTLVSRGYLLDYKYKITGVKASDFKYKLKNPNYFEFLDYVEEDVLDYLYANAFCFVYPSLSEGFGYPPLEAMRYKVPVISSPVSSMANILDSGALYFNPFSIEEIMNRMMMISEKDCHRVYSERGYQRYLEVRNRQEKDLDALIDYILE